MTFFDPGARRQAERSEAYWHTHERVPVCEVGSEFKRQNIEERL